MVEEKIEENTNRTKEHYKKIYAIQNRLREKVVEAENYIVEYQKEKTQLLDRLKNGINNLIAEEGGKSLGNQCDGEIQAIMGSAIEASLYKKRNVANIVLLWSEAIFGTVTAGTDSELIFVPPYPHRSYDFRSNRNQKPLEYLAGGYREFSYWAEKIPKFWDTFGKRIENRTLRREEFAQMLTILASNQSLKYPGREQSYNENLKIQVREFAQDSYTDGKISISPAVLNLIDANIERCEAETERQTEARQKKRELEEQKLECEISALEAVGSTIETVGSTIKAFGRIGR